MIIKIKVKLKKKAQKALAIQDEYNIIEHVFIKTRRLDDDGKIRRHYYRIFPSEIEKILMPKIGKEKSKKKGKK